MNEPAYFEIQTANPDQARHFYASVFGWTFTEQTGLPIPYWHIQTDGMTGGLLPRPADPPPPQSGTNAFTCSMQVIDFDQTGQKILANGGQVALEKFAIPGKCWQGYFLDPDGNTFGIFQVDDQAA